MFNYEFNINDEAIGKRIDQFLSLQLNDLSRSYIQKLIKKDKVLVNDKSTKANYKCRLDDCIYVEIPEPEVLNIEPENIPLEMIYEDQDIAVVNKPQGMVVHPAPGHFSGTLVNALLYHFSDSLSGINGVKRPGIVHRIDKDTSGLLMVCKNDSAHQDIAQQLKEHSVTRKYYAIVYHNLKEDHGTIEGPIGRHPIHRKKMAINFKNGKDAITHYRVLSRYGNFTLVELKLETGRTHQIRVHMASINHPLLGDEVYGPASKWNKKFNLKGQLLHAKIVGFVHPTTKEYMEFDSKLPDHFNKVLNKLEESL
ncbi:RluA family pseudouridine synthase [Vallitalea okinawensis]|uniref:RluA family pseudouridine synthase n=1 Tax=Vallitalea okinawensis TaxID=2078660 RepID=UPI000CFD6D9F|nr:RluA family pseudouridine synthase [Vallitalea okinawensis]